MKKTSRGWKCCCHLVCLETSTLSKEDARIERIMPNDQQVYGGVEYSVTVKWPLDFAFVADGPGPVALTPARRSGPTRPIPRPSSARALRRAGPRTTWRWNERNSSDEDVVVKSFQTYWQQFGINAQGTLRVQKLGNWVQRGTNTVTFINGVVQ